MISRALVLSALLVAVQGGELSVLFAPSSVQFQSTNDVLPESHVISIIQSLFGLEGEQDVDWRGLLAGGFFERPEALLVLSISGVTADLLNLTTTQVYETLEDDREPLNLYKVAQGLDDMSRDEDPFLFIDLYVDKRHNVHLEGVREAGLPRVVNLQLPVSNQKVMVELHAIRQTVATVAAHFPSLRRPALYHFHISGLEYLVDRYGLSSTQVSKAVTSLQDTVQQLGSVMRGLYSDNVAILALSHTAAKQPHHQTSVALRRLQQHQTTPSDDLILDLNLAPEFTWMYPEMFNISLWFMVTFSIIVFGVSWCVWFTDPGRDGVIYRMTTHHLKEA